VVYNPGMSGLLKAAGVGLALAVVIGVFWGYFPSWGFYMALLLGFGVAEGMAWAANYKKGRELQALSFVAVLVGLVVSRVAIGVFDPLLTVDMLLNESSTPFVRHVFYLEVIPDFVFMALPFLICFVRFR
jgi:hypothetical protein